MRKLYIFSLIALAGIIIGFAWAEQITLTTYYPAPCGVYRDFTVTRNAYFATQLDVTGDPVGQIGIGTTSPSALLEIMGGTVKASGGLIVETRDSDPAVPEEGQVWLRTDIIP